MLLSHSLPKLSKQNNVRMVQCVKAPTVSHSLPLHFTPHLFSLWYSYLTTFLEDALSFMDAAGRFIAAAGLFIGVLAFSASSFGSNPGPVSCSSPAVSDLAGVSDLVEVCFAAGFFAGLVFAACFFLGAAFAFDVVTTGGFYKWVFVFFKVWTYLFIESYCQ